MTPFQSNRSVPVTGSGWTSGFGPGVAYMVVNTEQPPSAAAQASIAPCAKRAARALLRCGGAAVAVMDHGSAAHPPRLARSSNFAAPCMPGSAEHREQDVARVEADAEQQAEAAEAQRMPQFASHSLC